MGCPDFFRQREFKTPGAALFQGTCIKVSYKSQVKCPWFSSQDFKMADEAFACTTAGGITPITSVDGISFGNGHPGLLTEKLLQRYWEERINGWHGTEVKSVQCQPASGFE